LKPRFARGVVILSVRTCKFPTSVSSEKRLIFFLRATFQIACRPRHAWGCAG